MAITLRAKYALGPGKHCNAFEERWSSRSVGTQYTARNEDISASIHLHFLPPSLISTPSQTKTVRSGYMPGKSSSPKMSSSNTGSDHAPISFSFTFNTNGHPVWPPMTPFFRIWLPFWLMIVITLSPDSSSGRALESPLRSLLARAQRLEAQLRNLLVLTRGSELLR